MKKKRKGMINLGYSIKKNKNIRKNGSKVEFLEIYNLDNSYNRQMKI